MSVKVIFEYDEVSEKWDPTVHGAVSRKEAKEAFNAVVLTCRQLDIRLLDNHKTEIIDSFNIKIIPAVW